jgi:hypothetical protein
MTSRGKRTLWILYLSALSCVRLMLSYATAVVDFDFDAVAFRFKGQLSHSGASQVVWTTLYELHT